MKAGLSVSMLSTSHWFPLTFTCTPKSVRARANIRTHTHAHACIRAHYRVSGLFGHSLSQQGLAGHMIMRSWLPRLCDGHIIMRSWLPRLCDACCVACPARAACAVCSLYICPAASRGPTMHVCVHRFLLACPPPLPAPRGRGWP